MPTYKQWCERALDEERAKEETAGKEDTLKLLTELIEAHCHIGFWRDNTGAGCHTLSFHGKYGGTYGLMRWNSHDLADCIRRAWIGAQPDEFVCIETDIW